MSARWTDQPARRICLEPSFVFPPVPDSVLGSERPSTTFAVEDSEVAHRYAERARLQISHATLLNKELVAALGVSKRVDSHGQSMPVGLLGIT